MRPAPASASEMLRKGPGCRDAKDQPAKDRPQRVSGEARTVQPTQLPISEAKEVERR